VCKGVERAERRARLERVTSLRRGKSSVGATERGDGGRGRERDLNVISAAGEIVPRRISFSRSTNSGVYILFRKNTN
jgi:hypothetical protein